MLNTFEITVNDNWFEVSLNSDNSAEISDIGAGYTFMVPNYDRWLNS